MKHHGTTLLIGGKLQLAPISSTPEKVLDIGTGTGEQSRIFSLKFARVDEVPRHLGYGVRLVMVI